MSSAKHDVTIGSGRTVRTIEQDSASCASWAVHSAYTYSRDRRLADTAIHETIGAAVGPHLDYRVKGQPLIWISIGAAIWGVVSRLSGLFAEDLGSDQDSGDVEPDSDDDDDSGYSGGFDPFDDNVEDDEDDN